MWLRTVHCQGCLVSLCGSETPCRYWTGADPEILSLCMMEGNACRRRMCLSNMKHGSTTHLHCYLSTLWTNMFDKKRGGGSWPPRPLDLPLLKSPSLTLIPKYYFSLTMMVKKDMVTQEMSMLIVTDMHALSKWIRKLAVATHTLVTASCAMSA